MKLITIGRDEFLKKDVKKLRFERDDLPKVQLFNSDDVIVGNPSSNIAIAFIWTWAADTAPKEVREFATKIANYSSMTGFWRTTNGGRYAFSNMLANPNINKLLLLVFDAKDNGHLLVDAIKNMWVKGFDENDVIIDSNSPNPKFEQVPRVGLERLRKQMDLAIMRNLSTDNFDEIEEVVKSMFQEPENKKSVPENVEFYSNVLKEKVLYDDGARFDEPYYVDLSTNAKNVTFEKRDLSTSLGQSLQVKNLKEGIEQTAAFIFKNGTSLLDERGILLLECRSFSLTVMNPLEVIPEYFDPKYIESYVEEFMNGLKESNEFKYTYHDRIFNKWGNQVEKIISLLDKNPNTRRALITLWDANTDLGDPNPPCLDFIWFCVRDEKVEIHVTYRSHHLATVTKDGKLMNGEGALVPNLYALGTLQKYMAEKLKRECGPLVLNDYSGHLYVNDV